MNIWKVGVYENNTSAQNRCSGFTLSLSSFFFDLKKLKNSELVNVTKRKQQKKERKKVKDQKSF